jgi:vacuolar protein sorting-associated protein 13A/C
MVQGTATSPYTPLFVLKCHLQIVSLEASAAETELVISSQKQKAEENHVGLSWTEGLGKYKLTKVITLTPRFLIKNNLEETIYFREHRVPPRENSSLEPNERRPLMGIRTGREKLLTVAFSGLNAQWYNILGVSY